MMPPPSPPVPLPLLDDRPVARPVPPAPAAGAAPAPALPKVLLVLPAEQPKRKAKIPRYSARMPHCRAFRAKTKGFLPRRRGRLEHGGPRVVRDDEDREALRPIEVVRRQR